MKIAANEITLDRPTFDRFRRLIYEEAGISLSEKKEALVSGRIGKRVRKLGLKSYRQYYDLVRKDETGTEMVELLNAISTNTTHFFRESRHFEVLSDLVRRWENQGQTRFRIWCAASSSGEEPYTIAMTLREAMQSTYDTKLLATDIDQGILASARQAVYAEAKVKHVPKGLLAKYFTKKKDAGDGSIRYEVKPDLKSMVTFGRINLAHPPFPLRGPLDIVFCRNVMIYFDNEVRRRLLQDVHRLLKPGGYLIVGHSESLSGMLSDFKTVEPAVYVKAP